MRSPGAAVERAVACLARGDALRVAAFRPGRAALILTRTPGMKPSLLAKGAEAVGARLAALGQEMAAPVTVPHEAAAVAAAVRAAEGEMVLILGGVGHLGRGGRLPGGARRRGRAAGAVRDAGRSRATCSSSASRAGGRWSACPGARARRR